jgi:hypothetical protein
VNNINNEAIKVVLLEGSQKLNFGGGMESFIIMLGFKIALRHIFNIPSSGLLIIDEGVSVLDKDHISKFGYVCNFIKQYYENIIGFHDFTSINSKKIEKKIINRM